ncbi:MAG: DNA damage-inducible protein D, partial [Lachnospiraceae bacterium]|nr:DNA damage-inducible protein D [Lachnospiraceae bacterium]
MDKKQIEKMRVTFDELAHHTDEGVEFWYARELMSHLGYEQWRNFENTITNAVLSCESAGNKTLDHFAEVSKMVRIGSGAE